VYTVWHHLWSEKLKQAAGLCCPLPVIENPLAEKVLRHKEEEPVKEIRQSQTPSYNAKDPEQLPFH
jgi:hypothetical protein